MTMHLGDVPASSTLYIPFATYAGATGASITLTGLAITDIEIYKNGSVTQRSSDAGYALLDTDGIDFDGITGIHGFSIDLSDNTDSGFYAVGSTYWVVVSAVTVDSQTVNFIAATFRIKAAEAIAGKPKVDVDGWLGTAAATPTVAGVPEVDVTLVAGSATDVSTIPASVAAILVDTAEIGTAGAGLTNINLPNQTMDIVGNITGNLSGSVGSVTGNVGGNVTGSVGSVATGGIAAASFAAGAIDAAAIAADAIGASEVAAGAWQELIELLFTFDATATYATADAGSLVKQIADNAGGSALTEAGIADAVWDEDIVAAHSTADTAGLFLRLLKLATVATTGTVVDATPGTTQFDTSLTQANDYWNDALMVFTDGSLVGQSKPLADFANANGGCSFDEAWTAAPANGAAFLIKADHIHPISQISNDVWTETTRTLSSGGNSLVADSVWDEAQSGHVAAGSFGEIATEIAAVLVDTNELQTDWADGGRLDLILDARASQTSVDTVDGIVDAILLDTAEIGTAGAGLTALPWNGSWDTEVQSEVQDALAAAQTESYTTNGATGSIVQLVYDVHAMLMSFSIAGTTITVKKLDGSTTAFLATLDDATSPTSVVRS